MTEAQGSPNRRLCPEQTVVPDEREPYMLNWDELGQAGLNRRPPGRNEGSRAAGVSTRRTTRPNDGLPNREVMVAFFTPSAGHK